MRVRSWPDNFKESKALGHSLICSHPTGPVNVNKSAVIMETTSPNRTKHFHQKKKVIIQDSLVFI